MSNDKNENKGNPFFSKTLKKILIFFAIVSIITPIILNILLYVPIPTPADLGNKEWVSGGYNDELNVSAEDIFGNVYVWK